MKTELVGPGFKLTIRQDVIPVSGWETIPDENWRYLDKKGHGHFYQDGYPTLKVCKFYYWCYDCNDDHTEQYYACKVCDETIDPATHTKEVHTYVHGLMEGTIELDIYDNGMILSNKYSIDKTDMDYIYRNFENVDALRDYFIERLPDSGSVKLESS